MGVPLDPDPVLFSFDRDYLLIYSIVVEKAAEARKAIDERLAVLIRNQVVDALDR